MIEVLKVVSVFMFASVGIAFAWALAELAVETIKEKYDGDKSDR